MASQLYSSLAVNYKALEEDAQTAAMTNEKERFLCWVVDTGKSSAAREPAASGSQMSVRPLSKGKHDKKCSENLPFQRLPEIPAESGGETFSWPGCGSPLLGSTIICVLKNQSK